MKRNTLILTTLAFVVVALVAPFELFGAPLGPLAALVLGTLAGWQAAAPHAEGAVQRGLRAGLVVGVGGLLGSVVGLALLGLLVGNLPTVQEFVRASEPHPEARLPANLIAPLAALGGVLSGFVLGLADLALSTLGGALAARLRGGARVTEG